MIVKYLWITPTVLVTSDESPLREGSAKIIGNQSPLVVSRERHGDEDHGDHCAKKPDSDKGDNQSSDNSAASFKIVFRQVGDFAAVVAVIDKLRLVIHHRYSISSSWLLSVPQLVLCVSWKLAKLNIALDVGWYICS